LIFILRFSEQSTRINVGKQILLFLIDDDPDDQEIFASVIENISHDIKCATAVNGKQALEKLLSGEVNPDLIFLDMNMPLMNGKQFLIELKKDARIKHLPVVILSTSSDKTNVSQARALGAIEFVTKPDRFSEWERVLKDLLSKELAFTSDAF
jgi:CheY-like chemotaxis protein